MNKTEDANIKIREKLFARCAAEHYVKNLADSDFARGMYCMAEIECLDKGSVLCVFLDGKGNFLKEVMLSRDFGRLHDRILDKVKAFCAEMSAQKMLLARRMTELDDIDYLIAGGVFILDELEKCGVKLVGYYITSSTSYINILPERG